jgi:hypothetical protein
LLVHGANGLILFWLFLSGVRPRRPSCVPNAPFERLRIASCLPAARFCDRTPLGWNDEQVRIQSLDEGTQLIYNTLVAVTSKK